MPASIGPVLPAVRPAPARLLKAMKAILVPGPGLPRRPDRAKATKRSHLSDRVTCTGPGSRGRLRPERRLVLGFSWSLNCGGFAWALTKAAHAPEGILAVLQGGRPPQTKSQPPSPSATVPEPLRPRSTQSRARETRKRETTAAQTRKNTASSRQRSPTRERRPPRPRTAAALDERRESKHTKSREARAVAATSDEDGHQLIQNFARTQA